MEKLPTEFGIKDLAHINKNSHLSSKLVKATHYLLLWISEGNATIEIDFKPLQVNAGNLVLISVDQLYRLDNTSEFKGKVLFFSDTFFNKTQIDSHFLHTSELLNPDRLNQSVCMDAVRVQTILSLLDEELKLPANQYQVFISQCYLRALLLDAERNLETGRPESVTEADYILGRRFCNEVESHFKTLKHTEHYMHMLGVCEKTLTRTLKLMTDKTPKRYIIGRVVLEAKRLMANTDIPVKDVATDLGFEETTNFNKYFLLHVGVTPIEFREKYQPVQKVQPLIIR